MPAEALDAAALEALYARMEAPLYNVVYRWLFDRAEARDVVQDAFLSLWRSRARVDARRAEPLLWRIALNRAANRRRSRRLWRLLTLEAVREAPAGSAGADQALAAGEKDRAVRRAVEALPEKLRAVVMLCELSGLGHAEIAEVLGIPIGTVASRRHAAMRRLEALLEEER